MGALITRDLLFGVYIRAHDFWTLTFVSRTYCGLFGASRIGLSGFIDGARSSRLSPASPVCVLRRSEKDVRTTLNLPLSWDTWPLLDVIMVTLN